MRKLMLLCIVIFSCLLFADQKAYQKVTGYHYYDYLEKANDFQIDLRYDIIEDKVFVYLPAAVSTVVYELDKDDRQKLIAIINKYFEWRQKAIVMEVELEKDINYIKLKGWFKYVGEWKHSCSKSCSMRGTFFSQTNKWHQLVFNFGKITDCSSYIERHPEQVYLEYDDVIVLREALTEEKLLVVTKEIKEKKEMEKAFK